MPQEKEWEITKIVGKSKERLFTDDKASSACADNDSQMLSHTRQQKLQAR